jgi:hypothetical protein
MRTSSTRHVHHPAPKTPAPKPQPPKAPRAAPADAFVPRAASPVVLKSGEAQVDLNGTKYTSLEGSAADSHLSIQRPFDPLKEPGIALTTSQAKALGVKVGDTVTVRDTKTNQTFQATYYDNAGTKRDGLKHFEVSPALADQLGISYRNKKGQVIDAVTNSSQVDGRFTIEH